MTIFLTSSPTGPLDGSRPVEALDTMNGFSDRLRARFPAGGRVLMIAASPDEPEGNDRMIEYFGAHLARAGLKCSALHLMDRRYCFSPEEIRGYDMIILGGGHVPTQNRFFVERGLKEALHGFDGILMGISAGTMNCAETVYVEPELPGEAVDPAFRRFIPGLGLTRTRIIPHYQQVVHERVDGMSFEEMNYPYSFHGPLLCLCDGAYVLVEDGQETVYGESYRIENGVLTPLCRTDMSFTL